MNQLNPLASTLTTYITSLPSPHSSPSFFASVATFSLLPIIFRRRNWRNAPPGLSDGLDGVPPLPHPSVSTKTSSLTLAKTHGPPMVTPQPPHGPEARHRRILAGHYSRDTQAPGRNVLQPHNSPKLSALRHVRGLLKTLYGAWKSNTPANIADSTFVVSANLISNLVCSKSLFDNTKEGRELKEMVWEILEVVGAPNLADLIPLLKVLDPQGLKRRVWKVVKKFDDFFEKLIGERLEDRKKGVKTNENGRLDMLDVFLDYRSEKKDDELKQFSRVDIKGMLSDMFVAGTDTSSSTVEWGMTEILKRPEIYKKILAEIDEVVGKERFVEETDIPKLTYFQAAVKEVFRLHPGVPLLIPRRTNEATEVCGYHVPKHAIVFVNVWGMARDPKVWTEPYEFRPDRFLGSDKDVKGQDFDVLPFGTGRRSCVGMPLGHRMVHYSLASLLHAFEWDFPADILEDMTEKVGITLQKAKGLIGVPKPRLSESVFQ
uniref:Geraniol 8-hydroxylase-like n=1 Tax=Nelumbo nucifera TaxID=4432 RepID=A0A822XDN7_NELNU|nr:TPA_asm: hypothetical protein HUJ06_019246 [Nelumbo nucifera]